MTKKKKGCPLLIQSDTHTSYTVAGESHTITYMLPCLEEKCIAFHRGACEKFCGSVYYREDDDA